MRPSPASPSSTAETARSQLGVRLPFAVAERVDDLAAGASLGRKLLLEQGELRRRAEARRRRGAPRSRPPVRVYQPSELPTTPTTSWSRIAVSASSRLVTRVSGAAFVGRRCTRRIEARRGVELAGATAGPPSRAAPRPPDQRVVGLEAAEARRAVRPAARAGPGRRAGGGPVIESPARPRRRARPVSRRRGRRGRRRSPGPAARSCRPRGPSASDGSRRLGQVGHDRLRHAATGAAAFVDDDHGADLAGMQPIASKGSGLSQRRSITRARTPSAAGVGAGPGARAAARSRSSRAGGRASPAPSGS